MPDTILSAEDMQGCDISSCELYETRSWKTCLVAVAEILERNDDGCESSGSGVGEMGQVRDG